jgi:hypothetical protein
MRSRLSPAALLCLHLAPQHPNHSQCFSPHPPAKTYIHHLAKSVTRISRDTHDPTTQRSATRTSQHCTKSGHRRSVPAVVKFQPVPGNHLGNSRLRGARPAAHPVLRHIAAPHLWYPGFPFPVPHPALAVRVYFFRQGQSNVNGWTPAFRCCPFVTLQSPTPSVIISQFTSRIRSNYGMPTLPAADKPSFQELWILWRYRSARSALA